MSAAVTASSTAWRRAATWRANGLPGPPGFFGTKRPRLSRTSPFGDGGTGIPPVGTSPAGGAAAAAAGGAAGPLDGVSTTGALIGSVNIGESPSRCEITNRELGPTSAGHDGSLLCTVTKWRRPRKRRCGTKTARTSCLRNALRRGKLLGAEGDLPCGDVQSFSEKAARD